MASGEMDRIQFTAFLQSSLSQMAAHARDGAILFTCWTGATWERFWPPAMRSGSS